MENHLIYQLNHLENQSAYQLTHQGGQLKPTSQPSQARGQFYQLEMENQSTNSGQAQLNQHDCEVEGQFTLMRSSQPW